MDNNYLLESTDSLCIKEKIQELAKKQKLQNNEISYYDLEEQELSEVLEDLDTYGLFSNKKIIVVYNVDNINIDTKEYKHLINYLKNPSPDNLLILVSKKLNNTKKLTKELKKNTIYKKIEMNATNYTKNELKDYNISTEVVNKIVSSCLEDISKIHNECEKLKNYKYNDKTITIEDVENIIIKKQSDITNLTFEFVRFLAKKDKKNMIKTYQELENNNIDAISLLGLIASQLRILYQVKILKRKHINNDEIAKLLNEKPYRITKTSELINYYKEEELLKLMQKLSDLDIKMKTTDADTKFLLEIFIINL